MYEGLIQRAAKVELSVTWPDGEVTKAEGENLMVHLRAGMPEVNLPELDFEAPEIRAMAAGLQSLTRSVHLDIKVEPGAELRVSSHPLRQSARDTG